MNPPQFETFRASSLFCAQCAQAQPVVEKLARTVADKQFYEYSCTCCGSTVGNREVTGAAPLFDSPSVSPPAAPMQIKIL
ncbi:MAG: hypothetical protein V4710_03660 [Verrucomicrobiota bacterium]